MSEPWEINILENTEVQLSDGIWQGVPAMECYWRFFTVNPANGLIAISVSDREEGKSNRMKGMSRQEIAKFLAKRIRQIVDVWALDSGIEPEEVWKADCRERCRYLEAEGQVLTCGMAYTLYRKLMKVRA